MKKFKLGCIVVTTHSRTSEVFGDIPKGTLLLFVRFHPKNEEHILVAFPGTKLIDGKLVPIHRAIVREATQKEVSAFFIEGIINIKELKNE